MNTTNPERPTVVVLTTGGTIASRPDPSGGVVVAATGEELIGAVPDLEDVAKVRVEELFRIGGYLMTPEDMQLSDLALLIDHVDHPADIVWAR